MSTAQSSLACRLPSRPHASVPAMSRSLLHGGCADWLQSALHIGCCRPEQGHRPTPLVAHWCWIMTGLLICVQARLAGSGAPASPAAPPLPSAGHRVPHAIQAPQLTPLPAPSLDSLLNMAPLGPQSSKTSLLRGPASGSHPRLSCSRQSPPPPADGSVASPHALACCCVTVCLRLVWLRVHRAMRCPLKNTTAVSWLVQQRVTVLAAGGGSAQHV